MKYSDQLVEWLHALGYTHCFFVAGGNIMHFLESCSRNMTCIPVVHEVAAGIAAEYFNEVAGDRKAFALVTAGPGITNLVTAVAGAFLESRELLVIAGQVKTADLSRGKIRQRGIQELDGVSLLRSLTVRAETLEMTIDGKAFTDLVQAGTSGRKGPVFIELPLDVQGRQVERQSLEIRAAKTAFPDVDPAQIEQIIGLLRAAARPVLLVGGGVSRSVMRAIGAKLESFGIPLLTTWNGADRVDAGHPLYFGRPNTWGQRSANLIIQQSDLVVALGTRLGFQQTGFNWQQFVPNGRVVQVDCDAAELHKGHPTVAVKVLADADKVFEALVDKPLGNYADWVDYCRLVRSNVPLIEAVNKTGRDYVSPFQFCTELSDACDKTDLVVPCSSGGAFTVMMQMFAQKAGQKIVTNKGLASMGYGLSGAIGASIAGGGARTILVEGDGGFCQNLQEIGTVAAQALNLKMFIFDDGGYASIRMTQRNYFGGRYVGCDRSTGLGLPNWGQLFQAYGIPCVILDEVPSKSAAFKAHFDNVGPCAFVVRIDPEQTYFPKITSRVTAEGSMESNPLHAMTPDLEPALAKRVTRYLV